MEKVKGNEPFWKSKTKMAGILAGVGIALGGLIGWLNTGVVPIAELWSAAIAILAVFGIRDLPVLNRK